LVIIVSLVMIFKRRVSRSGIGRRDSKLFKEPYIIYFYVGEWITLGEALVSTWEALLIIAFSIIVTFALLWVLGSAFPSQDYVDCFCSDCGFCNYCHGLCMEANVSGDLKECYPSNFTCVCSNGVVKKDDSSCCYKKIVGDVNGSV